MTTCNFTWYSGGPSRTFRERADSWGLTDDDCRSGEHLAPRLSTFRSWSYLFMDIAHGETYAGLRRNYACEENYRGSKPPSSAGSRRKVPRESTRHAPTQGEVLQHDEPSLFRSLGVSGTQVRLSFIIGMEQLVGTTDDSSAKPHLLTRTTCGK